MPIPIHFPDHTMYIILAIFALLMGFHVWAVRAYLEFMAEHPEVEKQVVARALQQGC